jgi:hypothetical protein
MNSEKTTTQTFFFLVVWRGVASRSICERWGWKFMFMVNLPICNFRGEFLKSLKFWGEFLFAKSYGEFENFWNFEVNFHLQNLVVDLRILEILRWIFICKILWWIWESLKFWGEFSFAKSCGGFENPWNFEVNFHLQNLVVDLRILEILRWIFICKILWWIWEFLKFWGEFSFAKSCGGFENPWNFEVNFHL